MAEPILPFAAEITEDFTWCKIAFDELLLTPNLHHSAYFDDNWFVRTASFSTISGLLTLFSKFFSSFLHSTCSLSVSHQYLVLEEVYLPFRAAIPNNPTLRNKAFGSVEAKHGIFTLFDSQFHGTYASTFPFATLFRLQFGDETPQILNLDSCRFARRYWGNLCWFLFLRLMICLSSAGDLAYLRCRV